MSQRTTLILLVIAALLTPLSYRAVRDARPHYITDEARPFSFAIGAVDRLEMVRGSERISIEKSPTGWDLVEPVEDRGRYAAIEDLLLMIRDLEVRGEGPEDSTVTGLDSAVAVVTVKTPSRDYRLELGGDHPSLPRAYARIDGRPVLIAVEIRDALQQFEVDELRDDAVCGASPATIQRLVLERTDQQRIELVREGAFWRMVSPFVADANPEVVERWLSNIAQWAIVDYIDPPWPQELGLDPPRALLSVSLNDGTSKTVAVGSPHQSKISGTVAVRCSGRGAPMIAAGVVAEDLVSRRAETLVSPYLVRIERPRIQHLSLSKGAYGKVDLQADPAGGWQLRWGGEERTVRASASLVDDWVEQLRQLKVNRWQVVDRSSLQRWGFDQPVLQVSLISEGEIPERIVFGSQVDGSEGTRYAWNPRSESLGVVEVAGLEMLMEAPFTLRDLTVTALPAGELRRLRITSAMTSQMLVCPQETWKCQGIEQVELPQPDVRLMVRRFSQMMARAWIASAQDAPRSDRFQLKVELFGLTWDEPETIIYFGSLQQDGSRLARVGSWTFLLAPTEGPELVSFCQQFLDDLGSRQEGGGNR